MTFSFSTVLYVLYLAVQLATTHKYTTNTYPNRFLLWNMPGGGRDHTRSEAYRRGGLKPLGLLGAKVTFRTPSMGFGERRRHVAGGCAVMSGTRRGRP